MGKYSHLTMNPGPPSGLRVEGWESVFNLLFKSVRLCPGQVAQLVGVLSPYTRVPGSIPGQGTYKNQPMSASMNETTNRCLSLPQINK